MVKWFDTGDAPDKSAFGPDDVGRTMIIYLDDNRNWWQKNMPLWLGGKNYIGYEKTHINGVFFPPDHYYPVSSLITQVGKDLEDQGVRKEWFGAKPIGDE